MILKEEEELLLPLILQFCRNSVQPIVKQLPATSNNSSHEDDNDDDDDRRICRRQYDGLIVLESSRTKAGSAVRLLDAQGVVAIVCVFVLFRR